MTGVALPLSDLPLALAERPEVTDRLYNRHGLIEVRFMWQHGPTVLPVRWCGSVRLFGWGCQKRKGTRLPYGPWVPEDRVRAGAFHRPERVEIPAYFGFQCGVWVGLNEGVRGVMLEDATGPVVYMLVKPSTNYYRNLTQQTPVVPVLINQVI